MSLILDALRKSERTRQQSLTGQLGAGEVPAGPGRLPVPWVPILAALLLFNGLLLWLFWPQARQPAAGTSHATPVPAAAYHPAVRPLSGEAESMDEHIPVIPPPPVSRVTPPGNPSVAAPQPAFSAAPGNVESLDSLPVDFRAALPALHLDVLGYTPRPAERFVVINLRRYAAGDTLSEGPKLVDIVAGGAVLEYRGTTFLLPP